MYVGFTKRVNVFPFNSTIRFHRQLALDMRRHFHTPMPAAGRNINVRQIDHDTTNNHTSNLRVLSRARHMAQHPPPAPWTSLCYVSSSLVWSLFTGGADSDADYWRKLRTCHLPCCHPTDGMTSLFEPSCDWRFRTQVQVTLKQVRLSKEICTFH